MVCVLISNFGGFIFYIYCRISVSAFWEKWRIGVSPYRVPVSVSTYPCNIDANHYYVNSKDKGK